MKKQKLNLRNHFKSRHFLFLLMLISSPLLAQQNNIKLALATKGKFIVAYERALSAQSSAQISFMFSDRQDKGGFLTNNSTYDNKGFRVGAAYRYYLLNNTKLFNGFYLAPNVNIGRHQLEYSELTNSSFLGKFASILASEHSYFPCSTRSSDYIQGKAEVTALGLGLKLGYQKRWKAFNFDLGVNFTRNSVLNKTDSFSLSNGEKKEYTSDISGQFTELYIGLGFAF